MVIGPFGSSRGCGAPISRPVTVVTCPFVSDAHTAVACPDGSVVVGAALDDGAAAVVGVVAVAGAADALFDALELCALGFDESLHPVRAISTTAMAQLRMIVCIYQSSPRTSLDSRRRSVSRRGHAQRKRETHRRRHARA
jgi:hypothetical protein